MLEEVKSQAFEGRGQRCCCSWEGFTEQVGLDLSFAGGGPQVGERRRAFSAGDTA